MGYIKKDYYSFHLWWLAILVLMNSYFDQNSSAYYWLNRNRIGSFQSPIQRVWNDIIDLFLLNCHYLMLTVSVGNYSIMRASQLSQEKVHFKLLKYHQINFAVRTCYLLINLKFLMRQRTLNALKLSRYYHKTHNFFG